jgi:hypothetical protein
LDNTNGSRPFDTERAIETLVRAFHGNEIKQRIQGKKKNPKTQQWEDNYIDYIEGNACIDRLNEAVTPLGWTYEVSQSEIFYDVDHPTRPTEVSVLGQLGIVTPWGTIFKEQFGSASCKYIDEKLFNDDTKRQEKTGRRVPMGVAEDKKAAATDALKKCATLLGVYNHGYRKTSPEIEAEAKPILTELRERYKACGLSSQEFLDLASGICRKTILGWGDLSIAQARLCLLALNHFPKTP